MISDHDKLGSAAKKSGAIACDQQAIADSSRSSRATQINSLITNLAKRNSMQYKQALARSDANPFEEQQRRVFRKLIHKHSREELAMIQQAVDAMSPLERHDWLDKTERELRELDAWT